ncbi:MULTISPECIES: roadblock/LC7 domain-containing protein [Streptomyces]|uniref:Roadblock/LC7 domain-containing protein n=1 Tax=Streptomyces triticiradicis TaxID=2651189 RepID=A0A7J5DLG5_9ACTN|nr:roadblock/LC7 domain-containing protein [Streptomyces triticiradicis]KAB1989533.1 roadblock/LC7 domain-containing protein [Streptomyces triticiradicis]
MRPDQLPEHPAQPLEDRHPGPAGTAHESGDDTGRPGTDLGWLLDDLVARTDHVRQAVLLTADGLPLSCSDGMRRRDIEHLAAVCSGFHGLARSVGERFAAGGVRQTMVMLDDAYLFITPAGDGSRLAVLSEVQTDVGQLAHEMALLVRRVGRHMAAAVRSATDPAGL